MYNRLKNGRKTLVKKSESARFLVSEKSIQHGIDDIRAFLETEKSHEYVDYNRSKNAYMLETEDPFS